MKKLNGPLIVGISIGMVCNHFIFKRFRKKLKDEQESFDKKMEEDIQKMFGEKPEFVIHF